MEGKGLADFHHVCLSVVINVNCLLEIKDQLFLQVIAHVHI